MLLRFCVAIAIALLAAVRGLRKSSLDVSGAIAGFLTGFLQLSLQWRFGGALLGFYFSASRMTKIGSDRKKRLEEVYWLFVLSYCAIAWENDMSSG
mmetsp:Transcript_4218/g.6452  ORF Transcript_4218/g.6452 Transcript_4218/m.6452 type:complete len:96 (+) Transcript_4218:83-370(+)